MALGQVANPILVAGHKVDFEALSDGDGGVFGGRLVDFFDVQIQVALEHPPVVKIVARHRRVLGEPDLGQAKAPSLGGIFSRFALCMAAKGRVHVIIRRQIHAHKLSNFPPLAKRSHAIPSPRGRRWPKAG